MSNDAYFADTMQQLAVVDTEVKSLGTNFMQQISESTDPTLLKIAER